MSNANSVSQIVTAASFPGGMARQFRVQVASVETPSSWKLVGSFRDVGQAGKCAAHLRQAGQQARVVDCRALPTAA
jgi:hypothetical protein